MFDIELLNITPSPPPNNNLFKFTDMNNDNKISEDEVIFYINIKLNGVFKCQYLMVSL